MFGNDFGDCHVLLVNKVWFCLVMGELALYTTL